MLARKEEAKFEVAFADLERLIGVKLPPSAFKYPGWWSNNPSNNSMTKVWLRAGWRSEQVDIAARTVVFRRFEDAGGAGARGGAVLRDLTAGAGFNDRPRGFDPEGRAPEIKSRSGPQWDAASGRSLSEAGGRGEMTIEAEMALLKHDRIHAGAASPFENAEEARARRAAFESKIGRRVRFEDLHGCMKGTLKIMPGVDVTAPVYTPEEWAEIEAEQDKKFDRLLGSVARAGDES